MCFIVGLDERTHSTDTRTCCKSIVYQCFMSAGKDKQTNGIEKGAQNHTMHN